MNITPYYVLAHASNVLFNLISLLIIVRLAMKWFSADAKSRGVRWVRALTDPMVNPLRSLFGYREGGFDFAPLLILLFVIFLQKVIPSYFMILHMQQIS